MPLKEPIEGNPSFFQICVLDQGNDLIGHNPLLGCCLLGMGEDGLERSHWEEVVLGPRKAVAMWHTLR